MPLVGDGKPLSFERVSSIVKYLRCYGHSSIQCLIARHDTLFCLLSPQIDVSRCNVCHIRWLCRQAVTVGSRLAAQLELCFKFSCRNGLRGNTLDLAREDIAVGGDDFARGRRDLPLLFQSVQDKAQCRIICLRCSQSRLVLRLKLAIRLFQRSRLLLTVPNSRITIVLNHLAICHHCIGQISRPCRHAHDRHSELRNVRN